VQWFKSCVGNRGGETMNEELRKAVEIMESIRKYFTTTVDMFNGKDTYNTPTIFSYTQNYGEAFNKILNLAQDYLSCGELQEKLREKYEGIE
jgi:hypothetical protein